MRQFILQRFSTATYQHSERKRGEGKTLSNRTPGNWRSYRCSAHRECVSDSEQLCFLGCGEKNPHSQGVQEAEFALVGIGIALLRFHAQKAAFALNRSGDFVVAGREIARLPECLFQPSAAVSCFSLAENGPLQPAAFLRRVSGLLCDHRKGAVCTSPWLHAECTTPTSEYYVSAFISSHNPF